MAARLAVTGAFGRNMTRQGDAQEAWPRWQEYRMKKRSLLTLIVASFMAAACVAPAQPGPASPAAAPSLVTGPSAVSPTPRPSAETVPVEAGTIPVEALRSATYSGIYEHPVTLTGGLYEGEPAAEGDASKPQCRSSTPQCSAATWTATAWKMPWSS